MIVKLVEGGIYAVGDLQFEVCKIEDDGEHVLIRITRDNAISREKIGALIYSPLGLTRIK
jgi:hypothetical protein